MADKPVVFISYSHKDKPWMERLAGLLAAMPVSKAWDDRAIEAGQRWLQEIMDAIAAAHVAVLLVSEPFLASRFIRDKELPALQARDVPILAVYVGPTPPEGRGELGDIQGVNNPALPLCDADAAEGLGVAETLQRAVLRALGLSDAPPVSNLPYGTIDTLFKGRDEVMLEMDRRLRPGGRVLIRPTALHGTGGVGKTRLAIEYALRHAGEFNALLFVGADSQANLRRSLADLCGPSVLNLRQQETPEENVRVEAALRWLSERPGWLLILDNVDTAEAAGAVEDLFPRLGTGRTIVTSRLSNWSAGTEPMELDVLSEGAATEFLLERTTQRRRTPSDDADAKALACDLDGLALALEQAGAYINVKRLALPEYRRRWAEHDRAVREWYDERLTKYPRSVATTWLITMDQLSPEALALLRLLSWLAPDPIPLSLVSDSERDGLAELTGYSLARLEGEYVRVHRLVQEVTRDRQTEEEQSVSLRAALRRLDGAYSAEPWDPVNWPALGTLLPHAIAVATSGRDRGIGVPTARLLNQTGLHLYAQARFAEAEPLIRCSLCMLEAGLGPEHPDLSPVLNSMAILLEATGRHSAAEPLLRRAVRALEVLPSPSPTLPRALNSLGLCLYEGGQLAESESVLRRALRVALALYGASHVEVAMVLNNLALLMQDTRRTKAAEALMRRTLLLEERHYGPESLSVARDLNNLAELLQATGRRQEAEPLLLRALAIDEQALGTDHPAVARDLNNLTTLLQHTGRRARAEGLGRRALGIFEQRLGTHHPDTATALNNLANVLKDAGRCAEAEPLSRRMIVVLASAQARTGREHANWAVGRTNYRNLLRQMGLTDEEAERRTTAAEAEGLALGAVKERGK